MFSKKNQLFSQKNKIYVFYFCFTSFNVFGKFNFKTIRNSQNNVIIPIPITQPISDALYDDDQHQKDPMDFVYI